MEPGSEIPKSDKEGKEAIRHKLISEYKSWRQAENNSRDEMDRSLLAESRVATYREIVNYTVQDVLDQSTPAARGSTLNRVTVEMGAALGQDFTAETQNIFLGDVIVNMAERITQPPSVVPQPAPKP